MLGFILVDVPKRERLRCSTVLSTAFHAHLVYLAMVIEA